MYAEMSEPGVPWLPQDFDRSVNLISTSGANDMPSTLLVPPPDFQSLRRPCTVFSKLYRLFIVNAYILFSRLFSSLQKGPTEEENTNIFQKFKKMSKDYWYVLVPVHLATSIVWFGGFYVMCKSGVDVAALLQWVGVSETYVEKLSNSEMGYAALAYACYKIATPIR